MMVIMFNLMKLIIIIIIIIITISSAVHRKISVSLYKIG